MVNQTDYEQLAIGSPDARRFVNQCGGCGRVGVKPDAPAAFRRFGPMAGTLRQRIGELPLDERGVCGLCARLLDERAAWRT